MENKTDIQKGSSSALISYILTNRDDLKKRIIRFTTGYGVVLQIVDDIREIEEDKLTSYTSFPLLEGKPFKKSFLAIERYLEMAEKALNPEWRKTRSRFKKLKDFVQQMKEKI